MRSVASSSTLKHCGPATGNCRHAGDTIGETELFDLFPLLLTADGTCSAEDISHCWLWRAIGGWVMVDVTLKLGHRGGAMYLGDPSAMFTAAVE